MVAHGQERRVFLFTSAVPSEGKTFCSTNFSVTLAQQGFRTLLIDADLRRPMAARVFFGEQRAPGLSDLLSSQVDFAGALHPTNVENLDLMPAGNRAPNPAELLADPRWPDILQEALGQYQRIVIDSPPVLAVSDSLLLAPHVDVTCLVLRAFKTPRKTFVRALKSLEEIHCRPAGIVFNFLPAGARNDYYYSGKYHGVYGGKGVYGT
jgi:capsular exopolysaccharide synthesis family protein